MIDARIPLMGQSVQLNSPLNMLARAQGVQNMMQTNRLNEIQMQDLHAQRQAQMEQAQAMQRARAELPDPPEDAPQQLKFAVRAFKAGLGPFSAIQEAMKQPDRKLTVVGKTAIDPNTGQAVYSEPEKPEKVDPNKPFVMVDGKAVPNQAYQDYELRRASASGGGTRELVNETRDLRNEQTRLQNEALRAKAVETTGQKQTAIATMEDSLRTINAALKHPGRETATGLSSVADPRNYIPATEAKNYQILANQITGKAFLQAFETLKGGGQITEVEGKKATDAIARLDRAQSDAEYVKALKDFQGVIGGAYKRATGKDYVTPPDDSDIRYQADAILRGGK